jgi:hypothetical protein
MLVMGVVLMHFPDSDLPSSNVLVDYPASASGMAISGPVMTPTVGRRYTDFSVT